MQQRRGCVRKDLRRASETRAAHMAGSPNTVAACKRAVCAAVPGSIQSILQSHKRAKQQQASLRKAEETKLCNRLWPKAARCHTLCPGVILSLISCSFSPIVMLKYSPGLRGSQKSRSGARSARRQVRRTSADDRQLQMFAKSERSVLCGVLEKTIYTRQHNATCRSAVQ